MPATLFITTLVGLATAIAQVELDDSQSPKNASPSIESAWKAWASGDVLQARDTARRLAANESHRDAAAHLLALSAFVAGKYEDALKHYETITDAYDRLGELTEPITEAYLHLGRFEDAARFARQKNLADWKIARFEHRAEKPLAAKLDELTVIPFADHPLTDYLPAFKATIQGTELIAHMDTGGTFLVMGPERAEKLGIEVVESGEGYHGAQRVKTYSGIAERFTLGKAVLENIPVGVLPTLTGHQDFVIFGTNVLQRFLATMDYPQKRLILSPRGNTGLAERHKDMLPRKRATVPFWMWGDHFMFARGSLGHHKNLNFFVDSGLVSLHPGANGGMRQAAFTTSADQFIAWGFDETSVRGGAFESNLSLAIGPVRRGNLLFVPGKVTPTTFGGVRIDALVSHAFLNQYAWTIDFDEHTYLFSEE